MTDRVVWDKRYYEKHIEGLNEKLGGIKLL